MNKAAKTKQYIIEKTAPIFNTKGYAVTSLSDITEATGLTKGSIYGNFSNKDEVVIEAFKHNVTQIKRKINQALNDGNTPKESLYNFVHFYRTYWERLLEIGGCALLNAAVEADDHLLFLKQAVQANFKAWQDRLTEVIKDGQLQGDFKQEIQAEDYAALLIILIEGGILLARTLTNKKHFDLALDRIILLIDTELSV